MLSFPSDLFPPVPLGFHEVSPAFGLQPATGGLTADMKMRSWSPTEKKRCGVTPW